MHGKSNRIEVQSPSTLLRAKRVRINKLEKSTQQADTKLIGWLCRNGRGPILLSCRTDSEEASVQATNHATTVPFMYFFSYVLQLEARKQPEIPSRIMAVQAKKSPRNDRPCRIQTHIPVDFLASSNLEGSSRIACQGSRKWNLGEIASSLWVLAKMGIMTL